MNIKFEKILPTKNQIEILFLILKNRKHSISHKCLPTFEEHSNFVNQNPYIAWYLIYKNESIIGNFYLSTDNSIGINFIHKFNRIDLQEIIGFIKNGYEPLPSIKSIRNNRFFINVPSNNKSLIRILKEINKTEIQRSFLL